MVRVIVCLAMAVFAMATEMYIFNRDLDKEWMQYKIYYNKNYKYDEELLRRSVWEKNIDYINKHNLEADMGVHTFWLGMNKFGDMTNEEFVKTMNTYKMSTRTNGSLFRRQSQMKLPESVDWRTKGYVTPIKDQGACGSCWAFSTTGSLEGQHFKKTGYLVALSEQNLVDCSTSNLGCNGGLMNVAFEYIKRNNGIDIEESYQYEAKVGECRFDPANVGATVTGYVNIKGMNEDDLQAAVSTAGPVSVIIDASQPDFKLYRKGVYESPTCSQVLLNHAVLAVGYGTETSKDYWLVKNSWGTGWGNAGYIKMSRNNNNNCGIATLASYPTV